MKQGTLVNKIVMLVLLGAVVIYLAVSAWNSLSDPFSTALSYAYTTDESMEVTGFLVREEQVIAGQGGIVDLLPSEGEKVALGETVALVYQSTDALERRQELRALELEKEQLQYALQRSDGGGDTTQLSQQILDAIVELRACVAQGDLTDLESQTMDLKSLVYKRSYTFSGEDTAAAIQSSIQSVETQIQALNTQSAQDTSQVRAQVSGIFSGLVDGYESLLTPDTLAQLTPSALDSLADRDVTVEEGSWLGKLITSPTWYFVCPMSEEDAQRLSVGGTITVRFSRDWSGEVDMQVESVSEPENGRVSVLLSTDRYLSDITLLRRQTVDLVFETLSGIRVPKAALRVLTQTTTDPDTGEEVSQQVTGVYALVGAQAEFKPVEVLEQQDDYCLVVPAETQTESQAKKALRAGDEIIVTARDLFDGKVVR